MTRIRGGGTEFLLASIHTIIPRGNRRPELAEPGLVNLKRKDLVYLGGTGLSAPGRPGGGALIIFAPFLINRKTNVTKSRPSTLQD
jgi:hypothetical protein